MHWYLRQGYSFSTFSLGSCNLILCQLMVFALNNPLFKSKKSVKLFFPFGIFHSSTGFRFLDHHFLGTNLSISPTLPFGFPLCLAHPALGVPPSFEAWSPLLEYSDCNVQGRKSWDKLLVLNAGIAASMSCTCCPLWARFALKIGSYLS